MKRYFEELMHEENDRDMRAYAGDSVNEEVMEIRKEGLRTTLKNIKTGKAPRPE